MKVLADHSTKDFLVSNTLQPIITCTIGISLEIRTPMLASGLLQQVLQSENRCIYFHGTFYVNRYSSFCEEDYAVTVYVAEFINTLTNLTYGMLGLLQS